MKKLPSRVLHLVCVADIWSIHMSPIHLTALPPSSTSAVKVLGEFSYLLNGATSNSLLSDLLLRLQNDLSAVLYCNRYEIEIE